MVAISNSDREVPSVPVFQASLSLPAQSNGQVSLENSARGYTPNASRNVNEVRHSYSRDETRRTPGAARQTTATQPNQPRYPEHSTKMARFESYREWPRTMPTPEVLSTAGFFYTGVGDLVRCFQCGIGLKDFSNLDDPLKEHVKHSDNCQFLVQFYGSREAVMAQKRRFNENDPTSISRRQYDALRNEPIPPLDFEPRNPRYATQEEREKSFDKWPSRMTQSKMQLVEAGFYYTGIDDHVRCFACDGGLRTWDSADDPWIEHCRWFPACPYARQMKGADYIALVQATFEHGDDAIVDDEDERPTGGLVGATSTMTVTNKIKESIVNKNKTILTEMGFHRSDIEEAVTDLINRGNREPTVDDIVTAIEIVNDRKSIQQEARNRSTRTQEDFLAENRRLKQILTCIKCHANQVNALLLPCTHHKLCIDCAAPLDVCPVCNRHIDQKIRTFMG